MLFRSYHWNGLTFNALTAISGGALSWTTTATGAITLTILDNKLTIYGTASGGNQNILLPNPASLPAGWSINIYNVGSSNSFVIKDYSGVTTYCTIAPGNTLGCSTLLSSGSVAFPPTSPAWTPGAPTPGPVTGPSV